MTGPQQSRPSPTPRDGEDAGARPSPRSRHGRADDDTPVGSYQGGGYPDLRSSRPVERPRPSFPGGYQDLYSNTGPQPVIDDTDTPTRPAYGEYGDPASRGGTAIDGGPLYQASARPANAPDARSGPTQDGNVRAGAPGTDRAAPSGRPEGGDATLDRESGGRTAVAERDDATEAIEATGPAAAVPAQRGAPEGDRRPSTVAEAAAARFGNTAPGGSAPTGPAQTGPAPAGRAAAATVAKDSTAVTVLRVITYVLVSLSCLIFLAGVVYGFVVWLELRDVAGTSPLFGGSVFGG